MLYRQTVPKRDQHDSCDAIKRCLDARTLKRFRCPRRGQAVRREPEHGHEDEHGAQSQEWKQYSVPRVNELGQQAGEEDADLRVGQIALKPLTKATERAHGRPIPGREAPGRSSPAGSTERLEPEPDQVKRADQFQNRESHGGRAHNRCHPDCRRQRPDGEPGADTKRCPERSTATMKQNVLGDHGGVRPGHHDHDCRYADEHQEVGTHNT